MPSDGLEFGAASEGLVFPSSFSNTSSIGHAFSDSYSEQKPDTLNPMYALPSPSFKPSMDTFSTLSTSPFLPFPTSNDVPSVEKVEDSISSSTDSESSEFRERSSSIAESNDGASSNASTSRPQTRSNSPSSSTSSGTKKRSTQHRPRPFRCKEPGCDRVFTSNYTRETHMLTHRPKPKQSYQCTIGCGALFSRKHDRFRHEVSQHGKPTQWTCTHCAQYFSSEKTLSVHSCDRPLRFQWRPQRSDEHHMIQ
jgi:hypothetical protein